MQKKKSKQNDRVVTVQSHSVVTDDEDIAVNEESLTFTEESIM